MHLRVNVSGGKPPTNSHVLNGLGNWEMKKIKIKRATTTEIEIQYKTYLLRGT